MPPEGGPALISTSFLDVNYQVLLCLYQDSLSSIPLCETTGAGVISLHLRVGKRLPVADRDAEDSVGPSGLTDQRSRGLEPDTCVLRCLGMEPGRRMAVGLGHVGIIFYGNWAIGLRPFNQDQQFAYAPRPRVEP